MSTLETLTVPLGERAYDILVGDGLIDRAAEFMAPVLKRRRVVVVTDEILAKLHLARLTAALDRGGIRHDTIILPPGEQTKDFAHFEVLMNRLLDLGLERRDSLVALGGGVIGDLTGFAASVLLRGVDFVQLPTTLLAQVDSSIGGKTGIDTHHGKNLVGAFHQPRLVLADTGMLATLPPRELMAGYAEVVKYGFLGDRPFFEWLEENGARVIGGDTDAQRHAVLTSCANKSSIVVADEKEGNLRALFNLGHTFGHALEVSCGFDGNLIHGEAVAIGMAMAFGLSHQQGLCPGQDAERAVRHMRAIGLPVHPDDLGLPAQDASALVAHMSKDKKVQDGQIAFILLRGIGNAFITREIVPETVRDFLAEMLARPSSAA
ncbi:MAG: 3-dehydroquinate synthase [Rhodospirillales bacterium]|nr:3-dehydroquinate synthase [Rhodospirillales bacterium]